jgi:hypothetical protein
MSSLRFSSSLASFLPIANFFLALVCGNGGASETVQKSARICILLGQYFHTYEALGHPVSVKYRRRMPCFLQQTSFPHSGRRFQRLR